MRIQSNIPSAGQITSEGSSPKAAGGEQFANVLSDTAQQVTNLEQQADQLAQKVASGDVMELHKAMLAMSRASTALELTVQVRNKVLEAYQEIMRMQV